MSPILLDSTPLSGLTSVVLDPAEAIADRTELDLNSGAIRVGEPGPDWGDAAIEQFLAEQRRGQLPVDFRVPNRQIQIPLILGADGPLGFDGARAMLQAKVALIQTEGHGAISRGDLYADVVNATLKFPDKNGFLGIEADVLLTLEALPEFFADEITLSPASGSGYVVLEETIQGDYPARARIIVETNSSDPQRGALIGVRARHASEDLTASLGFYSATTMTPSDAAGTVIGSSSTIYPGGYVTQTTLVAGQWLPVILAIDLDADLLTHVGSYQVWARCMCPSGDPPQVRLVWDVGDLSAPVENDPVTIPSVGAWFPMPLGQVRLDEPPVGDHAWHGQIQAKAPTDTSTFRINGIWIVPVDDGYTRIVAPSNTVEGLLDLTAYDSFDGTEEPLDGHTPQIGAVWATGGAATDWDVMHGFSIAVGDSRNLARRMATSATPRFAVVDEAISAQRVTATVGSEPFESTDAASVRGLVARYSDTGNHLKLTLMPGTGDTTRIALTAVISATPHELTSTVLPGTVCSPLCKLALSAYEDGIAIGRVMDLAGNELARLTGFHADLVTGGLLADGRAGLIDAGDGSSGATRWYDDVVISDPGPSSAVIYPGRKLEARTDGIYRENETGGTYGRVVAHGQLPRLPVSGLEDRTVQIFIKPTTSDLDKIPDLSIDTVTAHVVYRPCWLTPVIGS